MDSVFDDRELAIFEAKRIEEGTRYAGVKVVEENYDQATNLTTTRTLFRGGAAKARKTQNPAGPVKTPHSTPRTGTGKEPVHKGRVRPKAQKSSMVVPILVVLVLVLGGLTVYLAIQYFSSLQ